MGKDEIQPIEVDENGFGRYEMKEPVQNNTENGRIDVVHTHRNTVSFWTKAKRTGLAVAVLVGVGVGYKAIDTALELAPKPETTFDIDEFKSAISNESSVATGVITSTANVESSYSFLLGSAKCEGEIEGSQTFSVSPLADGSNISLSGKQIVIELEENEIKLDDQVVSLPNPSEICDANWVGRQGVFDDTAKAFKPIANMGPEKMKKNTEISSDSVSELEALNDGEAGIQIAQASANTYDVIGNRILELSGSNLKLVFEYNGEPISPSANNELEIVRPAKELSLK